jgi:hypothetical protein
MNTEEMMLPLCFISKQELIIKARDPVALCARLLPEHLTRRRLDCRQKRPYGGCVLSNQGRLHGVRNAHGNLYELRSVIRSSLWSTHSPPWSM